MRTIRTTYYGKDKSIVKSNFAVHPRTAVLHAVDHMQMNDYSAYVAEVYDTEMGELHAVITFNVHGRMEIIFRRDPAKPVCVRLDR